MNGAFANYASHADFSGAGMRPHQHAIARGLGIGLLGAGFGILMAHVGGARDPRQILASACLSGLFWSTVIGISIYADAKRRES